MPDKQRVQTFLLRGVLTLVPVVLPVAVLTFVMMRLLPCDPILAMMDGERGMDQTTYRQLRTQYGFDQLLPLQFATWLATPRTATSNSRFAPAPA